MKIAIILLGTLILTTLLLSCSALAFDNFKDFNRDRWDFDFSTEYYRTESNFGSNGTQENLSSGNYFQLIDMAFGSRFILGDKTAIYGSTNFAIAESKGFTGTRTNNALNQVILGIEHLAYSNSFQLIPEISLVIPTEKVSVETGNDVITSEGVIEIRPRITIQKEIQQFGFYANAGFTYRSEGRSFLLPWGVGGFTRLGISRLGVEVFGYQSMSDDNDTYNKIPRQAHLATVNGGSSRFGAFNPSIIDTNFFYHYNAKGPLAFQLSAGIPFIGTNTSNGFRMGAMLSYAIDFSRAEPQPYRYTPTPKEAPRGRSELYGQEEPPLVKSAGKFREDIGDGVDQRIFKSKALTPKKKKSPVLQEQLDDVEMQIELKGTRSKKRR